MFSCLVPDQTMENGRTSLVRFSWCGLIPYRNMTDWAIIQLSNSVVMSLFYYFRFFFPGHFTPSRKAFRFFSFFFSNDLFYAHLEPNMFAFTLFVYREIKWKEHLSLSSLCIFQLKAKELSCCRLHGCHEMILASHMGKENPLMPCFQSDNLCHITFC